MGGNGSEKVSKGRVYVCEECRKKALRGEAIEVVMAAAREFYAEDMDVYRCVHVKTLLV